METFRNQRSPGSDRFLGLFSSSPQPDSPSPAASAAGIELDEDDVFWTGADSSHSSKPPLPMSIPIPIHSPRPNPNPNPSPSPSPRSSNSFRRISDRNFGILAALPEDDKERKSPLLQRWPSISAAVSSAFASASTSPSSSSPRMIPALPKPKPAEYSLSVPAGKVYHQSAPVNVPVGPPRQMKGWGEPGFDDAVVENDGDEDEMLPPHEIVARASSKESPMTTFSVLEGAGRTLKGRDLRRVRNAVWRQTGFLD